jgi:hypothetical protein
LGCKASINTYTALGIPFACPLHPHIDTCP